MGSIGGALGVAQRIGGGVGGYLEHLARSAFLDGAGLGVLAAAAVVMAGCLLTLAALPSRTPAELDARHHKASARTPVPVAESGEDTRLRYPA